MDNHLWGVEVSIDLKGCNPETIRSSEKLREFLVQVSDELGVIRWGEPIIANFGDRDDIAGYSIVQLIETSLLSGHFVDKTNAAYVNLFSCKAFDPIKAANFTKAFFEATECEFMCNYRSI